MAYQESRQSLLAKIHIAKKDLALPEDVYRAMVVNITGKESCAQASYKSLVAMVAEMRAKGWKGNTDSWLNYNASPEFCEECKPLGGKIRAILLDREKSWKYAQGIAEKACGKTLQKCSVPELQRVVGILLNPTRGKKEQAAKAGSNASANAVKNAVLAYYRFVRKFAYVATECWHCDVVASDGARLVDIEVKISWGDFTREFGKAKYADPSANPAPKANRKYFAAPTDLALRIAADETIVEHGYGVIAVDEKGVVSIARRGKDLHRDTVPASALHDIAARLSSELITIRERVAA